MKDRAGWIEFCLGDVVDGTGRRKVSNGAEAKASLLMQMDQVMVRKVLGHLMEYIPRKNKYEVVAGGSDMKDVESEEESYLSCSSDDSDGENRGKRPAQFFSSTHAAWLYALSARLETPLHGDTCASLRGGIRSLATLRGRGFCGREGAEVLPGVNTVLEIWGRCFGQASEEEIDPRKRGDDVGGGRYNDL